MSGTGNGTTAPEQYRAYDPANTASTAPIEPGDTAILRNEQTGMYCQLRSMPSNATQLAVYCDQPTASTATRLKYTGSGFSYAGIPLVSTGSGAPLMLANTTAVAPGPTDDSFSFPLAGEVHAAPVLRQSTVQDHSTFVGYAWGM